MRFDNFTLWIDPTSEGLDFSQTLSLCGSGLGVCCCVPGVLESPLRSPAPDIVGLLWLQTLPMPLTAWCPIWLSFNCDTQVTKITHSLWFGGYLRKWSDILICCHSSCDCNSLIISRDCILATVFIRHICTALSLVKSVTSSSLYENISKHWFPRYSHPTVPSPKCRVSPPLWLAALCVQWQWQWVACAGNLHTSQRVRGGDSRAETRQTASVSSSYSSV